MLADILSKIIPVPGLKDAEMAASAPALNAETTGKLRADALAGNTQAQQPQGGVGGYTAGQTAASNYMPKLTRPIESIVKIIGAIGGAAA